MTENRLAQVQKHDTTLATRAEQYSIQAAVAREMPMLPVDQEFRYRLPRAGKIHLGVKVQTQSGRDYPKATDHFVLPELLLQDPHLRPILKQLNPDYEKPTALPIQLPCNALAGNLHSSCDLYGATRGLLCRTYDGVTCGRVDINTGEIRQEPCQMPACKQFSEGGCHWIHRLRFLIPDAAFGGVWQIDTTSPNNRANLLTEMAQLKALLGGHMGGVDLLLTLEPREFHVPILDRRTGEKKVTKRTAYLLHLRSSSSLRELQAIAPSARAYDTAEIEDFDLARDLLDEDEEIEDEIEEEPSGAGAVESVKQALLESADIEREEVEEAPEESEEEEEEESEEEEEEESEEEEEDWEGPVQSEPLEREEEVGPDPEEEPEAKPEPPRQAERKVTPKPQRRVASTAVLCEQCGEAIELFTTAGGRVYTVDEMAGFSRLHNAGHVLHKHCVPEWKVGAGRE